MTTTPSPPSPSHLRPAVAPLLPTVGPSVRDAPTKAQAAPTSSQLFPRPTQSTSSWLSPSQPGQPGPRQLAARPGSLHPGPEQPDLRPASLAPARSPSSQAYPQPVLPCHPHACSQILTFRLLPIKPHVIFIGKGRFCLYLCHACICTLPVNTNIPGTHWGHRGYQLKINQFT